ncbi:MAG: 16S rRNA (cytidine(1402)-2'-O)-methyltransferase [Actinomycetota bacterium]
MSGVLTLVATPIGNLGDLAPRAVEAFASADLVCCEDTRRTGSLLKHVGVHVAELRRLDDHTEFEAIPQILSRLGAGEQVVLVSDAGTPGISDPGERLVAAAIEAGFTVTTVPGPVAAVAALVASGLPSGRFVFEGFLARKGRERAAQLAAIGAESRTTVLYESPNRLGATLGALAEVCGPQRRAVVGRELTKLHEELRRGTLAELAEWAAAGVKGEIVVVVAGADAVAEIDDEGLVARLRELLADGASRRDAIDRVTAETGTRRGRVYDLALGLDPGDIHRGVTPPP